MKKTKYDAIHILKQNGWSDQEIRAIGLTLQDEGESTMPELPWTYKLVDKVSDISDFELMNIVEDGSAKTFVYRDLGTPRTWRDRLNNWINKNCAPD
jgi:hypothetical protein